MAFVHIADGDGDKCAVWRPMGTGTALDAEMLKTPICPA
jgi:hypothetical protein